MSILVDENTRVLVQGMTGKSGNYHSGQMMNYGTKIVAGVTPGRGGSEVHGVPIYNKVREAVDATGADTAVVLVPGPFVKEAVFEDIDAGIKLIVCLVEGVPVKDSMLIRKRLQETGVKMLGPNCPGIVSPGKTLIGFMPGTVYRPGRVGIVSRSGTFSYQVADAISRAGIGQSTCAGIGGDPITGMGFEEVLEAFEQDPETDLIVLVGEIGRTTEEEAARYIKERITKPVCGIILGRTAPPGKQMGHAGAIVSAGMGTYESKVKALREAGVAVALSATEMASLVSNHLGRSNNL